MPTYRLRGFADFQGSELASLELQRATVTGVTPSAVSVGRLVRNISGYGQGLGQPDAWIPLEPHV